MTIPKIDHTEAVRPDSIVQTTIGGVACWAFTVKAGDVQPWDSGNRGSNGKPNERAEISYAPAPDTEKHTSPLNVREGMLQTYDVDYQFKPGFPPHVSANHEWGVLTQFHPQPGAKGIPGFPGATVHDGQITFENPSGDSNYLVQIQLKTGTWIRLRMVVKWAPDKMGYVKIVDRGTGALIGRYDGPTIAPGEFKYIKQGYYRAGGLPDGTVYETQIDITDGDLTETATTTPAPAPGTTNSTVQIYSAQLIATRDALKAEVDAINALLGKP